MIRTIQEPTTKIRNLPEDVTDWLFQYTYHGWPVLLLPSGEVLIANGVDISWWRCFDRLRNARIEVRHPIHCILCVEARDNKGNPSPTGPVRSLPALESGRRDAMLIVHDVAIRESVEVRAEVLRMLEYRSPFVKSLPFELWDWPTVNISIEYALSQGYRGIVMKQGGSVYSSGPSEDWIEVCSEVSLGLSGPFVRGRKR